MFVCQHCHKSFPTVRQLNGHKRLHGKSNGKYSKSRKKITYPTFKCLTCGTQKTYNPKSSRGKFCSKRCFSIYRWETEGKLKVILREGGDIKRYLIEEFGHSCMCCKNATWLGKPILLMIGFKDGKKDNHHVDNLLLLCPNCFSG